MYRYFQWVKKIQQILKCWHDKFNDQNISYDEFLRYANSYVCLDRLGKSLKISSLIVSSQEVDRTQKAFLKIFEALNLQLLCFIPDQPDAKWCTLPFLLEEYGLHIPPEDQKFLNSKIGFPGHYSQIPEDQLGNHPNISSKLMGGHGICLRLHKSVTFKELLNLLQNIQYFLKPFTESSTEHLRKMLIFFKLNKSFLFDKYLRSYLTELSTKAIETCEDALQFDDDEFSFGEPSAPSPQQISSQGITWTILVSSLQATSSLIEKIMKGTATYREIIAKGTLNLGKLDIEREFAILSEYVQVYGLSSAHCKGLEGIQGMLELFQYTTHIKNIIEVCEQYQLANCLQDPLLLELQDIMNNFSSEEDRSNTTPVVAREKITRVKEVLYDGRKIGSRCLDFFAAMKDSVDFYKFIREKQFYGQAGTVTFLQQYQLITAHLQHEEYDDKVLNHLLAAFKVISPFMVATKSFKELMQEVTTLNAVNGLKQLETVNANITLINLWFSRAEVGL